MTKNIVTPPVDSPSVTLSNGDFAAMRSHMLAFLIEDCGLEQEQAVLMVNHHRTLQRVFGPLVAWYADRSEERLAKLLTAQEATAAFLNGGISSVHKKLV